ncbi:MAG: hypothetical protein KF830_12525 [Planctomycetes bacterium]|nr:hypothetical protein [Planctomycetota bacterium]
MHVRANTREAGAAIHGTLAIFFLLATAIGAVLLPYDEDASPCEWFGIWNGVGFEDLKCQGSCPSVCTIEPSQVVENTFWCWCRDGGNVVNCYGGAQQGGGVLIGVTCYESPSGCSSTGHRCIRPDHSQGWNGQVGLGYRMCQCLQP